jgi:deoxyribodipyrimidine photo-lyase
MWLLFLLVVAVVIVLVWTIRINGLKNYIGGVEPPHVVLFTRDFRVEANPIFDVPARHYIGCFILTEEQTVNSPYRSADCLKFMLGALTNLQAEIERRGGDLVVLYKTAAMSFADCIGSLGLSNPTIHITEDFTPFARARLSDLKTKFTVITHNTTLLGSGLVLRGDAPYKKFTPYYEAALRVGRVRGVSTGTSRWVLTGVPQAQKFTELKEEYGVTQRATRAHGLQLIRDAPTDYGAAQTTLAAATSGLSPYLKFGLVDVAEVYHSVVDTGFRRQLYWRDFYYTLAKYNDGFLPYDGKPVVWWGTNDHFTAWCEGRTGVQIVDACMKQLNTTGELHGRGRLIVADFLVKILGVDWRLGERYFATKLTDYDPIINNYNWQWVAGCAPWAQPKFRVFWPFNQQKTHDADGAYVATYKPAVVEPIVDLHAGRRRWLSQL